MRWSPQYHVACQIQKQILAKLGLDLQHANQVPKQGPVQTDLTPGQLKQLTDCWIALEERKRIIRMKPKPRDVDVTEKPKKARPLTFHE